MSEELAAYIADYINEEYQRQIGIGDNDTITSGDMILKAIDAYQGGAR